MKRDGGNVSWEQLWGRLPGDRANSVERSASTSAGYKEFLLPAFLVPDQGSACCLLQRTSSKADPAVTKGLLCKWIFTEPLVLGGLWLVFVSEGSADTEARAVCIGKDLISQGHAISPEGGGPRCSTWGLERSWLKMAIVYPPIFRDQ